MPSWQRIIYYLSLAVVEATPPALLLTVTGNATWGSLLAAALAGALADWIVLRRLPPARQGLALAGLGLLTGLWVVKAAAGEAGPFTGWGTALGQLFTMSDAHAGSAYLSLLVGLYCFWRGTRLTLHDSVSLHRLFRTSTVLLMLIVVLGFFSNGGQPTLSAIASTEVLSFFAVGLLAIALAAASEERETELQRMGWRGMLTLAGSIVMVLAIGVLVGALFGHDAAMMLRLVWQGVVFIVALIVAPIIYLLAALFVWLFRFFHLERIFDINPQPPQLPDNAAMQATGGILGIFPVWVQVLLQAFLAIVPVLLILLLLYIVRRRRRRGATEDEERESLWSWSGLAKDVMSLLNTLRPAPPPGGLRAALAQLRGPDPANRIRRSYIRFLLFGEQRNQPRAANQTAREYAPIAGTMVPEANQHIAVLTTAYEQARYNPESTTAADADMAERAWASIEQFGADEKPGTRQ